MNYDEVERIVSEGSEQALGRLRRVSEEQTRYDRFVAEVKAEYKSIEDFILQKVFGEDCIIDKDGKRYCSVPQEKVVKWRENDFPYALDGVTHYILWSTVELTEEELQQHIKRKLPGGLYCSFVNPPALRSVSKIWHAHIMCANSKN